MALPAEKILLKAGVGEQIAFASPRKFDILNALEVNSGTDVGRVALLVAGFTQVDENRTLVAFVEGVGDTMSFAASFPERISPEISNAPSRTAAVTIPIRQSVRFS